MCVRVFGSVKHAEASSNALVSTYASHQKGPINPI